MDDYSSQPTEEQIQRAHDVVQIIKTPGFQALYAELSQRRTFFTQDARFYKGNPDEVGYHAGALFLLDAIDQFIEEQKNILNDPRYVQEKEEPAGGESGSK